MRRLQPGDVGWIIHRQAVLYHEEYGWDWTYEALASRILGRLQRRVRSGQRGWLGRRARRSDRRFDFPDEERRSHGRQAQAALCRAIARGAGLGRTLVATCIARARELGYREITLWTNDILVAARHIYQAAEFRLVSEAPHHSFGHDLVGQTWTLDLG